MQCQRTKGGGAIAPLTYFGICLIPISISGEDYAHQITTYPSPEFSDIPAALQLKKGVEKH